MSLRRDVDILIFEIRFRLPSAVGTKGVKGS